MHEKNAERQGKFMKNQTILCKKVIVSCMAAILAAGVTGCGANLLCVYPGCDNIRITAAGACYKHGKNASVSTDTDIDTDSSSLSSTDSCTKKDQSKEERSASKKQSTGNNSGHTNTVSNAYKFRTRDVEDYDNPDDYASDFAEDYAYDEFGEDSWEAYEYGYEEAYEHWMDEMGE